MPRTNLEESFADRVISQADRLRPAERRVAQYIQDNREETLIASALALAEKIGTSDATVVRTVKALNYAGLEALRRGLADELRLNPSPSTRLARTLTELDDSPISALEITLDIHQQSLDRLRHDISPAAFAAALDRIIAARRVFAFGIGPSSALSEYLATQLQRFGLDSGTITQTGLLLADQLLPLTSGDVVLAFAYGRVYPELQTVLDHAGRIGAGVILISDTLGARLRDQVAVNLPVQRGRSDMFSMHTATMALVEALLVALAKAQPEATLASLNQLNDLRRRVAGKGMDLPLSRFR